MTDGRPRPEPPISTAAKCLVLTIEVPGFYVDDYSGSPEEVAEEIEVAMQLVTEQVGLTFVHTEGDSPQVFVKPMEGRIIGYGVRNG